MTPPLRKWTAFSIAARIVVFAILCVALLAAALAQSQQQSVKPSSQGTVQSQSAPQPTPQPSQTPPPSSPPPASGGTPYTTPDGSASVIVPAGWKVTEGGQGLILLAGPNVGEAALLAKVMNAHNAPYVPGQKGADNTELSMPYAAGFQDKVAMVVEQIWLMSGKAAPQGAVTSVAPIPVPGDIGQCGAYGGNISSSMGQFVAAGSFCSMPLGMNGDFKTILNIVQLPASESASLTPLTQSILRSYNAPVTLLEEILRPFDQPAGHIILMNPVSAQCFQLGVMHLGNASDLPRACGGTAPN